MAALLWRTSAALPESLDERAMINRVSFLVPEMVEGNL